MQYLYPKFYLCQLNGPFFNLKNTNEFKSFYKPTKLIICQTDLAILTSTANCALDHSFSALPKTDWQSVKTAFDTCKFAVESELSEPARLFKSWHVKDEVPFLWF